MWLNHDPDDPRFEQQLQAYDPDECLPLIHKHGHEFEAEFDRMYPKGQPVPPEYLFQGTILELEEFVADL